MDPLERIALGQTGVEVTRLGLGGVFVGGREQGDGSGPSAYDTALATLRKAYEMGIRYFDTAPFYGRGRSEKRFGKVLGSVPRSSFVLSTKVGRRLVPDLDDPGTWVEDDIPHYSAVFDMSRDGILRALEDSLERHQLGHVDILYLHDPDWENLEDEAIATAFPAMRELKEQGVVKAIGTGMNQWQMPARFMDHVELDIVLLAGRYTLLDHDAYAEFLPLCLKHGTKIATGGPYNSGILAATDFDKPVWFNYQQAPQEWLDRARALKAVCDRHNVDLKAAALQFPLAHPAVACVIPGAASPSEVEQNVRLIEAPIPSALWDELRHASLIPADAPTPS
ncbi:MAG: aldo/keto reductase [Gammaproteobacteria bacterium]|nr:aldo/keto reductase [Gammaproteobacteria bacterium]